MHVKNRRPVAVEIVDPNPPNDIYLCEGDGTVEVPDALGKSLLDQADNWDKAKPAKVKED